MSGRIPISSGQPTPSFKMRYDLFGAGVAILAIMGLFIGLGLQYNSLWKGGSSGSNEVKDQFSNTMAYFIPTILLILLGWGAFALYSSSVNKATILWIMGMMSIIISNIALVASLFQVKVVSQY